MKKKIRKSKPKEYQIVLFRNKKQIKYFGSYTTAVNANKKFLSMIKENEKNIIFPVRFVNDKKIKEVKYELAILKKDNNNYQIKLPNEIGEYITTTTSSKYNEESKYGKANKNNYIIYDKYKYDIEETFWIYGYHPVFQRKNFDNIFKEFIMPLKKYKMSLNRILCFKNKLLIETEDDINIIICKNISDCFRLYTMLEEWSSKYKIKNILWCGNYKKSSVQYWLKKIHEKTNWNKTKIMRKSTRP